MNLSTILLERALDGDRGFVRNALSGTDWHVIEACDDGSLIAHAQRHRPDLILLGDRPGGGIANAVASLRTAGRPVRSTPILALTQRAADVDAVSPAGLDGRIATPTTAEALIAALALWRPAGDLAATNRLIETFGAAAIAPLVWRFSGQLADALSGWETTLSADELHRIAGVAGTLGFGRIGASWDRLSQGDTAIAPAARREARLVLAQIDRDPRFAASE